MPKFGSSGRNPKRYPSGNDVEVFTPEARKAVVTFRQGGGAQLGKGRKSSEALGQALAAAGGELPKSMWKAARKGKLTRKG